jgi:hypothetical protein
MNVFDVMQRRCLAMDGRPDGAGFDRHRRSMDKPGVLSRLALLLLVATGVSTEAMGRSEPSREPPETRTFDLADHSAGQISQPVPMQGLWVRVEIREVGMDIAGRGRSKICGVFENHTVLEWRGGYRVTDGGDTTAHASMRVPAEGVVAHCETLNPQLRYTVVVRRDGSSTGSAGPDASPRPSRLAGFLASGGSTTPAPSEAARPASAGEAPESPPAGASNSRLAGFLQEAPRPQGQDRHVPSGGFSTLVDGQLQRAQASYQEEQRILREREEARRRAEAARLAREEAARRAEQERIAQIERQRAEQQKSQSSGFFGAVLGIVAGAAIGVEMGLDANQALEMASTFGDIGKAVETGDASDAMAAQASANSFGARLDAASPSAAYGAGSGGTGAVGQNSGVAGSDGPVQRYSHTFSCGPGEQKTIEIPYTNARQLEIRKRMAEAGACNDMDAFNSMQNQCIAETGKQAC